MSRVSGATLMAAAAAAVLAVLLAVPLFVAAQFPIPKRYDGFAYSKVRGQDPVLLEAFFDPLCPDSSAVWPTLKQALDSYGDDITFILHPFALPYHQNSFFSARALHIAHQINASLTYPLLDLLFKHQDDFSNARTASEPPISVISRFASLFSAHFGENFLDEFKEGFHKPETDQATRISFKYACSRAVTGTPIFLLNGVPLSGVDETWGITDWSQVLDPLLDYETRSEF